MDPNIPTQLVQQTPVAPSIPEIPLKKGKLKFILIALTLIVLIVISATGYFLGKRSSLKSADTSINPSPTISQSASSACPFHDGNFWDNSEDMVYTVKAGDTFSSIAKNELGDVTRVNEIFRINSINPEIEKGGKNVLEIGQSLFLPPKEVITNGTGFTIENGRLSIGSINWGTQNLRFPISQLKPALIGQDIKNGECVGILYEQSDNGPKALTVKRQSYYQALLTPAPHQYYYCKNDTCVPRKVPDDVVDGITYYAVANCSHACGIKRVQRLPILKYPTNLASPDNSQVAIFTPNTTVGEGQPSFTNITVINVETKERTNYNLSGPLLYARDIFWSPIDNRLYFTHSTNGIGIYALWSCKIDGTDSRLISGSTDEALNKNQPALINSAAFGATDVKFSSDGEKIITKRRYYGTNNQIEYWIMNYNGSSSKKISQEEYNILVQTAI